MKTATPKNTTDYISVIKLLKKQWKREKFKTARAKWLIIYRGTLIKMTINFSSKLWRQEQVDQHLKTTERKKINQPRIL